MLRVLTYHRIIDLKNSLYFNPRMVSATPANFDRQMRYVSKYYHAVSMAEVLNAAIKKIHLPKRSVLITFDDAYYDFGKIAWPILKRYHLPATLFVPTAYPDQPERSFWWDRLYRALMMTSSERIKVSSLGSLSIRTYRERIQSLKQIQEYVKGISHTQAMELVDNIYDRLNGERIIQKSVLTWDELRKLAREGVTMSAHTKTHPIMTRLSSEEVRKEIVESKNDLQREIGDTLPIFCYPAGGHDDTTVRILQEEGFKLAFTTRKGQNDLNSADLLRLRRQNITPRTTIPIFAARLTRWVSYLDAWRHQNKYMPAPVNQ